ncbi:MAG: hypothetical protein RLZZ444_4308, partial [Pseudomonadota bacterium]
MPCVFAACPLSVSLSIERSKTDMVYMPTTNETGTGIRKSLA